MGKKPTPAPPDSVRLEALELLVAFGVDRGVEFDASPGDARILIRDGRAKPAVATVK